MSKRWKFGHLRQEQFFLHARTTIHTCKQMGLDVNFKEAKVALNSANLDLDIAKTEYSSKRPRNIKHEKKGEKL